MTPPEGPGPDESAATPGQIERLRELYGDTDKGGYRQGLPAADRLVQQLRDWRSWQPPEATEPVTRLASIILTTVEANQLARRMIPVTNWSDCMVAAEAILADGWSRAE
jgi:hypothetical protein